MSSQKWFITGASGGLGLALTEKVLAEGHRVVAAVRRVAALESLKQSWPDQLEVESVDVTRPEQVQAVAARHPDADVVVNNAGGAVIGAMEELSEADIQHQIALNLLAPIHVTRAFLPAMRARKHGTFIHVTSVGGRAAFPSGSMYHAAKYGLEGFAESVSQEVAGFGISVTLIEPTGYATDWAGSSAKHATPLPAYEQVREQAAQARARRFTPGDPAATRDAVLTLVDTPNPPLRLFLGEAPLGIATADYESRLATWREWQPVAAAAQGHAR